MEKYRLLSLGFEPVSLGLAPGRCLSHKLQEVTNSLTQWTLLNFYNQLESLFDTFRYIPVGKLQLHQSNLYFSQECLEELAATWLLNTTPAWVIDPLKDFSTRKS